MFGPTNETEFDINFSIFGIPVRIQVGFWIIGAILAWSFTRFEDMALAVIVVLILLISILVHELGHALTQKYFGQHPHILLYGGGGLAITHQRIPSRWKNILISFNGPLAGFYLAAIAYVTFHATNYFIPDFLQRLDPKQANLIYASYYYWMFVNLFWGIFNLIPIHPLDGGQIARELITWWAPQTGIKLSLYLSLGISCLVIAYSLSSGHTFLAILIFYCAMMNYQELQRYSFGPRNRF